MSSVVNRKTAVSGRVKGIVSSADEKSLIGNGVPLGASNPKNPRQRLVKCSDCGKPRYVVVSWRFQSMAEANGWIKDCPSCIGKRRERNCRENPILDFPCGGSVNLNQRNPINNDEVEATCGICTTKHFVLRRHWKGSWEAFKSYCEGCWPLIRVALRREHASGGSAERDDIYAKIRDIRRALEVRKAPQGARTPFCILAREWDGQNLQANSKTRDGQSYHVNLLSFHFGITPISDVSPEAVGEFRHHLLELPPTRGAECGSKRSEGSVNQTLMALRRILSLAYERRWLRKNPVGKNLTPSRRERKPTPLVTVDEENRLLAACIGTLAYLQEILICLIDTGMEDATRQRLRWRDVNFNAGLIKGSGVPVMMTPRLRSKMLALWEHSGRDPDDLVWSGRDSSITRFKRDLGTARVAAQVQGLHVKHLRPTAAWRMRQAGQEFLQIGAMLGCKPEYLQQYLETDPNTAQREKESPSFRKFIAEQFGGSLNGNVDGQKNVDEERRERRLHAEREEFESIILTLLGELPRHKIGRSEIAALYDIRRKTLEALDPSTITKIVNRCYPKGTTVADAVALIDTKR